MAVCKRAALALSRRFLLLSTDSGTTGNFFEATDCLVALQSNYKFTFI